MSGVHERGTSHYELLGAFQDGDTLERMESEAEARGYRRHEFGDSVFVERSSFKFVETMKDDDLGHRPGRTSLALTQNARRFHS